MEWSLVNVILFLRLLTRDENYKGKKYCIGLKDAKDLTDFFDKWRSKRQSNEIDEETYQFLMDQMAEKFREMMAIAHEDSLIDRYIL